MNRRITGLKIVGGLAALLVLLSVSNSFAKSINVKGSGSDSFVTAFFTYDGLADALIITGSGKDNLGGSYTFQQINEVSFVGAACTAPDQSAGVTYALVAANQVTTYKKGQLYGVGVPSSFTECVSTSSPSSGGSIDLTVSGGTGSFANVTGDVTAAYTGDTLAAPGTPPGSSGIFGGQTYTETGSITK